MIKQLITVVRQNSSHLPALIVMFIISAGSTASLPTVAATEGLDFSGTYLSDGVVCFTPNGTGAANATVTGYSERIQISGNEYMAFDDSGTCTTTTTGKIVFRDDGSVTISGGRISVPSGSCTFSAKLTSSPPDSIQPKNLVTKRTDGDVIAAISSAYVRADNGNLGLYSTYRVSGSPDAVCFLIYVKQ